MPAVLCATDKRSCRCARSHDATGQESSFQGTLAVGTATTETGRFADTVEAINRSSVHIQHTTAQVSAQAAETLARNQLHMNGNKGPRTRLLQRRRLAGAQAIRPPLACMQDATDLVIILQ